MTHRKKTPLTVPLQDGTALKTSADVAYAWLSLGGHSGWSRISRPEKHANAPMMLVPKKASREIAAAALNAGPDQAPPAGVVLLNTGTAAGAEHVKELREARKDGTLATFFHEVPAARDFILTRITTAEILDLVAAHGTGVAARALEVCSLPAKNDLISRLGRVRAEQVYAENPHLEPPVDGQMQDLVVEQLTDQAAAAKMCRILGRDELTEAEAHAVEDDLYGILPTSAVMALASNKTASWPWLRQLLDAHEHPEVALASATVGELTESRRDQFDLHPDPVVRARFGARGLQESPSWDPLKHGDVLDRVADMFDDGPWSVMPYHVDPDLYGPYSISRQWAARTDRHPEAEKTLRQLTDLHNRSWARQYSPDPRKAAQVDAARIAADSDHHYRLLDLPKEQTVTVEDVRQRVVVAVANGEDLPQELVAAVQDAAAAESAEQIEA